MKKIKLFIILGLCFCLYACSKDTPAVETGVEESVTEEGATEDNTTEGADQAVNTPTVQEPVKLEPTIEIMPEELITPEGEASQVTGEPYRPATLPVEGNNKIFTIDDSINEEAASDEADENEGNGEDGVYPRRIDNGTTISIDLDNDSKEESVCLNIDNFVSMKVNGKEYGDKNKDSSLEDYDVYPVNPSSKGYYITDIDAADNYKEIAFLEYGPSDDLFTYFFRYDKGKLFYIGGIPCFPFVVSNYSKNSNCFDGAGKIYGDMRLGVFQTWWAPTFWELNQEGNIELVEQDWYYPAICIYDFEDEQQNYNSTLLQKITVYETPDTEAAQITLEPNDSLVFFLATDNKEWIWLKREDGTGGFLNLSNYNSILYDNKEFDAQEIFSNLCYAD